MYVLYLDFVAAVIVGLVRIPLDFNVIIRYPRGMGRDPFKRNCYISFSHFVFFPNGENGRFRTNIQKSLEIEHIFVPSQYLVGAGNHICRTPNALKTS